MKEIQLSRKTHTEKFTDKKAYKNGIFKDLMEDINEIKI